MKSNSSHRAIDGHYLVFVLVSSLYFTTTIYISTAKESPSNAFLMSAIFLFNYWIKSYFLDKKLLLTPPEGLWPYEITNRYNVMGKIQWHLKKWDEYLATIASFKKGYHAFLSRILFLPWAILYFACVYFFKDFHHSALNILPFLMSMAASGLICLSHHLLLFIINAVIIAYSYYLNPWPMTEVILVVFLMNFSIMAYRNVELCALGDTDKKDGHDPFYLFKRDFFKSLLITTILLTPFVIFSQQDKNKSILPPHIKKSIEHFTRDKLEKIQHLINRPDWLGFDQTNTGPIPQKWDKDATGQGGGRESKEDSPTTTDPQSFNTKKDQKPSEDQNTPPNTLDSSSKDNEDHLRSDDDQTLMAGQKKGQLPVNHQPNPDHNYSSDNHSDQQGPEPESGFSSDSSLDKDSENGSSSGTSHDQKEGEDKPQKAASSTEGLDKLKDSEQSLNSTGQQADPQSSAPHSPEQQNSKQKDQSQNQKQGQKLGKSSQTTNGPNGSGQSSESQETQEGGSKENPQNRTNPQNEKDKDPLNVPNQGGQDELDRKNDPDNKWPASQLSLLTMMLFITALVLLLWLAYRLFKRRKPPIKLDPEFHGQIQNEIWKILANKNSGRQRLIDLFNIQLQLIHPFVPQESFQIPVELRIEMIKEIIDDIYPHVKSNNGIFEKIYYGEYDCAKEDWESFMTHSKKIFKRFAIKMNASI